MRIHHYHSEDDNYFNEYADTIKYDALKDRLHWQHKTRKDILLDYSNELVTNLYNHNRHL